MSYNWLSSKNRKRQQREMNKLMRRLNKNVENDYLWKGRFYVRQIGAQWYEYIDKSGAELIVVLCFYDKKTNANRVVKGSVNHWRMWDGYRLWWQMNNFIIDDVNAKEK